MKLCTSKAKHTQYLTLHIVEMAFILPPPKRDNHNIGYLILMRLTSLHFTDVAFFMNWRQDLPPAKRLTHWIAAVLTQTGNISKACGESIKKCQHKSWKVILFHPIPLWGVVPSFFHIPHITSCTQWSNLPSISRRDHTLHPMALP